METNRLHTNYYYESLSLILLKLENSLEQEINSTNNIDAKLIKIKENI
jgi:hypothetical protein